MTEYVSTGSAAAPDRTHCDRLRTAFDNHGYLADRVANALGTGPRTALARGEPQPARRACAEAAELGTLIRLFLLGDAISATELRAALHPLSLGEARAAGILTGDEDAPRAALEVRPHSVDGNNRWIVADRGTGPGSSVRPDRQIPGFGEAARSLTRAMMRRPVRSLLDLGTGCGALALHGSEHAERVTGTDTSARALALARATFLLNAEQLPGASEIELLRGPWFTPVRRRRFDQVVCHPPVGVGPGWVDSPWRDSGLAGDDASALVVRQLPSMLNPGGVGQVLATWLHRPGTDWTERVTSWLPPTEVDAWFVQQGVVEPERYVADRLRGSGFDPATPAGGAAADAWLDWFEAERVDGVGYGLVTLRHSSGAGSVTCESLPGELTGSDVAGWLDRAAWLRANPTDGDLLRQTLSAAAGVSLLRSENPGEDGWCTESRSLRSPDGSGRLVEADDLVCSLVAGCQGMLPLEDLLGLLAAAHDLPTDDLVGAALPAVRELIRGGILLPAEQAGTNRSPEHGLQPAHEPRSAHEPQPAHEPPVEHDQTGGPGAETGDSA